MEKATLAVSLFLFLIVAARFLLLSTF